MTITKNQQMGIWAVIILFAIYFIFIRKSTPVQTKSALNTKKGVANSGSGGRQGRTSLNSPLDMRYGGYTDANGNVVYYQYPPVNPYQPIYIYPSQLPTPYQNPYTNPVPVPTPTPITITTTNPPTIPTTQNISVSRYYTNDFLGNGRKPFGV